MNWQNKAALKLRMRAILADIFVRYFSDTINYTKNDTPPWLVQLLSDMEHPENFTGGTEKMVKLSNKSREHLARCLKKYYAVTSAEYINELRLNYASNLLLHTNTSVIEVCFECGFQSVSYFYKVFKKKYGVLPSKFRELYK